MLISFIPYFILGEGAAIRVFDNLDGEIIYKILTARKGYWLNYDAVIPEIMNGLPRFCITSGLNFTTLMFGLFPPFIAYLVNDFIMRLIGFVGMYFLLKHHILSQNNKNNIIAFLISCGYVLIPYFTIYGLTDLGQPLLLYGFLNILKRQHTKWDYVWIIMFPFFSSFVLSGFFVGVMMGILWIIWCIREKKFLLIPFLTVLLYALCSLLVEFNMIIPILKNFHSHREEAIFPKEGGSFIFFTLKQLWETYIHPGQFFTLPIWLLVIPSLALSKRHVMIKTLGLFLLFYLFIMLFFYFCPSIKGFRLSRFYHLLPLCWMLLFAVGAQNLWSQGKFQRYWVLVILIGQISFLMFRSVNYATSNNIRNSIGWTASYNYPSYHSFYAEDLFKDVAEYIGKKKEDYKVLNVGILPAVAQYNGFYTLDSYQNNYPLKYKHDFRKIIEKELNKNEFIKNIYDTFGNWCYVFPAEVSPVVIIEGKIGKDIILHDLILDNAAMKVLHCNYVFSAVQIAHCEKSGLRLLNVFKDKNAHWDVWLYEVE